MPVGRRLIEFVETDEPIQGEYGRENYFVTVEKQPPTRVVRYRINPRNRRKTKFDDALTKILHDAKNKSLTYMTISSGDLHQLVNKNDPRNQMQMACDAMWDCARSKSMCKRHDVLHLTSSGSSPTLVIRYYFY